MVEDIDDDNCHPPPLEYIFTSAENCQEDEGSVGLDEVDNTANSLKGKNNHHNLQ